MTTNHSARRTIVKAMTYRITGLGVALLSGSLLGMSLKLNFDNMILSNVLSTFVYVFHELAWRRSRFGKPK